MHQQVFPIQSLQPEILAAIFIFCLPEIGGSLDDAPMTPIIGSQYAPLLLCNVCSSWRNLAISTPQLWQTFDFVIKRTSLDAEPLAIGIRTWLGRSGTLPLTINFKYCANDDWDLSSQRWQLFEPLFQCASRWESCLLVGVPKPPCSQSFGALPVLRKIGIARSDFTEIPFTSAPCLTSLSLMSLPSTSESSLSAIPWDQLTELRIQQEQLPSTFLDIIRHCPRLQSLSLRLADPEEQVSQPSAVVNIKALGVGGSKVPSSFPITHDTLRCLRLDFTSLPHASLESIILPALIELECECRGFGELSLLCPQLFIFFTQSNCQLQTLALIRPKFTPNELLECLQHRSCQTLTHLVVKNDPEETLIMFDEELLVRLTYSEDKKTAPICPKLAQLELYFCYLSYCFSPYLMGKMIQSRCFGRAQGDRLKSLKIKSMYPISAQDHELLWLAEEEGELDLLVEAMNDMNDSDNSDESTEYEDGG